MVNLLKINESLVSERMKKKKLSHGSATSPAVVFREKTIAPKISSRVNEERRFAETTPNTAFDSVSRRF